MEKIRILDIVKKTEDPVDGSPIEQSVTIDFKGHGIATIQTQYPEVIPMDYNKKNLKIKFIILTNSISVIKGKGKKSFIIKNNELVFMGKIEEIYIDKSGAFIFDLDYGNELVKVTSNLPQKKLKDIGLKKTDYVKLQNCEILFEKFEDDLK
jgi:hypothetical protein